MYIFYVDISKYKYYNYQKLIKNESKLAVKAVLIENVNDSSLDCG